jgi:hypothetical protein
VTVGSYPGDGVRLKLSGTDEDEVETAADWLRERVTLEDPDLSDSGGDRSDGQ